jgi:AbrB family looped-hinge helix DNA binding protein
MSTVMKISPQGQIRIPKKVMQTLHIEKGDYVEVGWYWTKEWQKMEAEVDEELEKNQLSPEFHTAEEGLEWLKK